MEFKISENMEEENLEKLIEEAKKQIEEKKYEQELKEKGFENITKIIFAFKGKEFKLEII